MGGWMHNGWVDGWIMDGWMDGWVDDGWIDRWMDRWMDGWMNLRVFPNSIVQDGRKIVREDNKTTSQVRMGEKSRSRHLVAILGRACAHMHTLTHQAEGRSRGSTKVKLVLLPTLASHCGFPPPLPSTAQLPRKHPFLGGKG
jgi:hypothetical protein